MTSKEWYPLESSPQVFTSMARSWGVDSRYALVDVLGLDDDLLKLIPKPVHAVIFLFPDTPQLVDLRAREGPILPVGPDEKVGSPLWIPQVDVGHACGTFALVHSLAQTGFAPKLEEFIQACRATDGPGRTSLFQNSEIIHQVHSDHVAAGQTLLRETDWEDCDHFIAFVKAEIEGKNHVIELDGAPPRSGALDRGEMSGNGDDLLKDVAQIVKDVYIAAAGDNIHFSLIALVG